MMSFTNHASAKHFADKTLTHVFENGDIIITENKRLFRIYKRNFRSYNEYKLYVLDKWNKRILSRTYTKTLKGKKK